MSGYATGTMTTAGSDCFYPGELPKTNWLQFYGRYFSTVEINNSFYHLPAEKNLNTWRDSSASDFIFSNQGK